MATLVPIPFEHLLKRIFYEVKQQDAIFDLPSRKFYRGREGLDTSVHFCGNKAATPVGPAAGPQTQLAQNIVLSWLAGGRIIELKTVQINDRITLNRPCIDISNVGYNVEWSQELSLADSLREYVKASMLVEIIHTANLLRTQCQLPNVQIPEREHQAIGTYHPALDTIFDISVGYDLAGIQSKKIRSWLERMKDATTIVEEFRKKIPDGFSRYRDLDFKTEIANSVTLSTFHGCPADEIEQICCFLLREMDFHVIIKMNPPMLGKEKLEYLLYDRLGYHNIEVNQKAYEANITFNDAVDVVRRLKRIADKHGKVIGVKFTNTLEVMNKGSTGFKPGAFKDAVMYLSGAPLHVLALSLVDEWRKAFGDEIPISFSAGIDANNFPDAVGINLVPITTCTDLLRPGGYGRLQRYLVNLEKRMESLGVQNIGDYIIKYGGNGVAAIRQMFEQAKSECGEEAIKVHLDQVERKLQENLRSKHVDLKGIIQQELKDMDSLYENIVSLAGLLNTPDLMKKTVDNDRYFYDNNKAVPRKIGRHLYLWDCINCDKCIPVCPNDANFFYEVQPLEVTYSNFQVKDNQVHKIQGSTFKIHEEHQIANYADLCNDCGNCDVFCPEDGGPYIEKPRFFGSMETYRHDKKDGFFIKKQGKVEIIFGRIRGKEYTLRIDTVAERAFFSDGIIEVELDWKDHTPLHTKVLATGQVHGEPVEPIEHTLDMENYYTMAALLKGVLDTKRVNYINVWVYCNTPPL